MTSGGGGRRGVGRRAEGSGGGGGERKSEAEREKTKLRERRRRSITTKILEGLRKHGGYELPPRADINDVLRALAREAGWVVLPDGTTYRADTPAAVSPASLLLHCTACAAGRSATPTPTSSLGGGTVGHSSSPLRQPPGGALCSDADVAKYIVFGAAGLGFGDHGGLQSHF